jgi:hypothetical protein
MTGEFVRRTRGDDAVTITVMYNHQMVADSIVIH